jgi:hypothetical protein
MSAPTWFQLRGIGNSTPARMTLLIPFLGLILIFSGSMESLYTLSGKLLGISAETIMHLSRINLHLLYFGLVLIAIATALYNKFCPDIIKTFDNPYAYHENELRLMTARRANTLILRYFGSSRNSFDTAPSQSRALNVAEDMNRGNRNYWLDNNSTAVYDLIQEVYDIENSTRPRIRRLIQCIWIVGFGILVIPSGATLLRICVALYSNIASTVPFLANSATL